MRIASELSILFTSILFSGSVPSSAQDKIDLPEGAGKPLLVRICSKCHGLENVVRARNTKEKWSSIIDDMVSRGSEGTDEELDKIVDYLTANFGKDRPGPKVNVNKASASELVSALGLSKESAEAIVAYREKNGEYKQLQDLAKVPAIDLKPIERQKERLEFGDAK